MSRPVAVALSYLQGVNEATSADLVRETRLSQPVVSYAMKELRKLDLLDEREEKNSGKGRPTKVYSLKIDFDKVIAHIERQRKEAVDDMQAKIDRLKELNV